MEGRVGPSETGVELVERFQLEGVDGETVLQSMNRFGIEVVVSAANEKVHISADDVWNMTVAESDVSLVGLSDLFHSLDSFDLGKFSTDIRQSDAA